MPADTSPPERATLPPAAPAPSSASAPPPPTAPPGPPPAHPQPPPPSIAVQLVDRVGDIVGMVILGLLCHGGKIGGVEAMIAIGAILGVGTGLRQVGARAVTGGAGLGVTGLLLLGAGQHLAPFAGAALTAAARAKGAHLTCLLLLAGVAQGAACSPAREALLAPHHGGACDPGADASLPSFCRGAVPYVCSRQGHAWPATPSGAPCPWGCVSDDGGARCGAPAALLDASSEPGGAP